MGPFAMGTHDSPRRRTLHLHQVLPLLRAAVGLHLDDPPSGEPTSTTAESAAEAILNVDTGAWLSWSLAGLRLFATPQVPSLRVTTTVARRVVLEIAIDRTGGNITHMARCLGSSRRTVRENLRRTGLQDGEASHPSIAPSIDDGAAMHTPNSGS